MGEVLHKDDPTRWTVGPRGRRVRNLTAEEYAATYAEGTPHTIPDDVMAAAIERARAKHGDSQ